MADSPDPFVPSHIDRRNKPVVLFDFGRLMSSMLWAKASPIALRAALALWSQSLREMPAASLPDDPEALASWAKLPLKRWAEIADRALHGFVKCSDGRLHHRVLADAVIETWNLEQAASSAQQQRGEAQAELDRQRAVNRERVARHRHERRKTTGNVTCNGTGSVTGPGNAKTVTLQDPSPLEPPLPAPTPPNQHPPISPQPLVLVAGGREQVDLLGPAADIAAEMVRIWGEELPTLAQPRDIKGVRRTALLNRMRDTFRTLPAWRDFCRRIRGSPFLMGEETGWRIDIDTALTPKQVTKILEGGHDRAQGRAGNGFGAGRGARQPLNPFGVEVD